MKLSTYNKKRDFKNTPEPKGKLNSKSKKRFVIQHHFARKEHYDFRLEHNGVLLSFAVPKGLSESPTDKRLAVHVEDHPIDYINFKGVIPQGNYGAGTVEIFDKGTYTPLEDIDVGLKKGHIKFALKGKRFEGVWSLVRTDEPNWLIIKSNDEIKRKSTAKTNLKQDEDNKLETKNSKSKKNTKSNPHSSKQKELITQKPRKAKNPFASVEVKLAKLTDKIPSKDYIFEIKYDGYRIVAFVDNTVKLRSQNNKDYSSKFPNITESLKNFDESMVLDGEVVVFDNDGKSDFGLLTDHMKAGICDFCYVVFDILALNGNDLRKKTIIERKKLLENVMKNAPSNILISSFVKNGKKSFEVAKKLGLEGIVAKKMDSTYNGERDNDWLKIKCYKRQEFVIGGYSISEKNKDLSTIYVGYYKKNKLIFVGKVGTGFDNDQRIELSGKFKNIKRKSSPFDVFVDDEAIWVSPKYVAEIQYAEFTKSGVLRQPSFLGLRTDKKAKEIFLEEVND